MPYLNITIIKTWVDYFDLTNTLICCLSVCVNELINNLPKYNL